MGSRVETPTWLGSSHQWPWWRSPPQLLSSRATPAMPSSCRSRDLTPVLESLEQPTHRRTELCSGRSLVATMRGSDSTATLTTRERLSLLSTPLASMGSGSLRATTSPPEVRTQPWQLRTQLESLRNMTTSITMTDSLRPFLSTPTTPLITLSIFWAVTLPAIWLVASSQHQGPDLQSPLSPGGRATLQARSSWIGSPKVSTSTSGLSRAEPTRLLLDLCAMRKNVQSFYVFSFGLISTYSIKNETQ